MSPFAEALRTLRSQAGLRQQALSKLAGCDRSYLSALETGLKPAPSAAFVETLIRALNLAEDDAEVLRSARERSRHTYTVAPQSSSQTHDFVYELFQRLEHLSLRQIQALQAVLEIDACGLPDLRARVAHRAGLSTGCRPQTLEDAV